MHRDPFLLSCIAIMPPISLSLCAKIINCDVSSICDSGRGDVVKSCCRATGSFYGKKFSNTCCSGMRTAHIRALILFRARQTSPWIYDHGASWKSSLLSDVLIFYDTCLRAHLNRYDLALISWKRLLRKLRAEFENRIGADCLLSLAVS